MQVSTLIFPLSSLKPYLSWSLLLRTQAFRLQPLQMSGDLIKQLNAVAVKLESCANSLQELINQKKNKHKYYKDVIEEVRNPT